MPFVQDLLNLQIPDDVCISPNGKTVAYTTRLPLGHKTGDHFCSTVWIAETGVAGSSRKLRKHSDTFNDRQPQWSPAGDTIAFISDRAKRGESNAIYLVAINSNENNDPYPLTPPTNEQPIEAFSFSPDGNSIVYISPDEKAPTTYEDPWVWNENWPYNRLRIVTLATQQTTTLVHRPAHVTSSFAWSPDGRKIAFAEARTPDIESVDQYGTTISIVDVANKDITEICTFPKMLRDLIWMGREEEEENALYFIAGRDTESLVTGDMVWQVDLDEPLRSVPAYKACAYGDVECPTALKKVGKSKVLVSVQHGMCDQIRMLNGQTMLDQHCHVATWDAAVGEDGNLIVAFSKENVNSSREISSRRIPSSYPSAQLSTHGSSITSEGPLGSISFLRCRSSDNKVDLDATMLSSSRPVHTMPLPTLVYLHGGPYGRVTNSFDPSEMMWIPHLLSLGYAILCPNYRGSSSRGNAFASAIRGCSGTIDYDDVIALTQHAIDLGIADKTRLVAAGWSMGGFLAFLCTVRNGLHGLGWRFQATIAGAGISDGDTRAFTSDIGGYQDDVCRLPPWKCLKSDVSNRSGSAIWEFRAAVEKGDVLCPILILHGERDERVPLEQSVGFRRALMSAESPFDMVVYPGEPHMFVERRHLVDLLERIGGFVQKHLGKVV